MSNAKPRRVKALITRTVTEIATVILARDGSVDEFVETHEERDMDDVRVVEIRDVLTVHP